MTISLLLVYSSRVSETRCWNKHFYSIIKEKVCIVIGSWQFVSDKLSNPGLKIGNYWRLSLRNGLKWYSWQPRNKLPKVVFSEIGFAIVIFAGEQCNLFHTFSAAAAFTALVFYLLLFKTHDVSTSLQDYLRIFMVSKSDSEEKEWKINWRSFVWCNKRQGLRVLP